MWRNISERRPSSKKTQKVWFIVHESFVLSFIEEVEQPEGNVNNAVLDKKL